MTAFLPPIVASETIISMLTVRLVLLSCEMLESQNNIKLESFGRHMFARMSLTLTVHSVSMQVVPLQFSTFGKSLIYLGHMNVWYRGP